jgi:hypothetical protein
MLSFILVTGMFAEGFFVRDHRKGNPSVPPTCIVGLNGNCGASDLRKSFQTRLPIRECPADSSMVTIRPDIRYCIPDRPIGE